MYSLGDGFQIWLDTLLPTPSKETVADLLIFPQDNLLTLSPTGIASGEAFGSSELNVSISALSILSSETFGSPGVSLRASPSGIASAETFGNPAASLSIAPSGITSAESFGTLSASARLSTVSIQSAESVNVGTISSSISTQSIPSSEAFGTLAIGTLKILSDVGGVASAESLGQHDIDLGLFPESIDSLSDFGSPSLTINVSGLGNIASTESVSTPAVLYALGVIHVGTFTLTAGSDIGGYTLVQSDQSIGNIILSSGSVVGPFEMQEGGESVILNMSRGISLNDL